jgi:cation:H+ antiporter
MNIAWLFLVGVLGLSLGAELLVRAASQLALSLRVPPLVIGLTVVAYGTSAPEFAVSTAAALNGRADIALGNAVGSNIFNVLFILGVSALLVPLPVNQKLIRLDVPVMIGVSALLWWLAQNGIWSRLEGAAAFAGLVGYTGWQIWAGRTAPTATPVAVSTDEAKPLIGPFVSGLWALLLVFCALGLLVLGSRLFVDGAVQLARLLRVNELVIGLTIVAAGTSLPEMATSVWAAIRGMRDIAIGNIVGSNIFNILGVLGAAGVLSPNGIAVAPQALDFDIPVMVTVAVVCLPMFFTGRYLARWEGFVLLAYYVAYVTVLILGATGNPCLGLVTFTLAWGALPLTVLVLAGDTYRGIVKPCD